MEKIKFNEVNFKSDLLKFYCKVLLESDFKVFYLNTSLGGILKYVEVTL